MVVLTMTMSQILGIDCIGYMFLKGLSANAVFLCGRTHYDHVTDLRDRLHWLHVPERIIFKCCLLVCKQVIVLRTKMKFGDRSFSVSGPATWNALPHYIRDASSVDIFKSRLKTYLFGLLYDRTCFL